MLEKIVLKATEFKLASCWVGYFDADFFSEIQLSEELKIPSIVIVGYSTEEPKMIDKFMRFAVKARTRNEWSGMFFEKDLEHPLDNIKAGKYGDSLEAVRLAPSSGNTQPWRIVKEEGKDIFHFYKKMISKKYEQKGLHDVDLGICLAHFEILAGFITV